MSFPLQEKKYKCPFFVLLHLLQVRKLTLKLAGKTPLGRHRKLRQGIVLLLHKELLATLEYDNKMFHALARSNVLIIIWWYYLQLLCLMFWQFFDVGFFPFTPFWRSNKMTHWVILLLFKTQILNHYMMWKYDITFILVYLHEFILNKIIYKTPWLLLFTVVFLQLLNESWTLEKVNRRCRVSEPVEFGGLPSPHVDGQLALPAAAAVSLITYRFPYTVVIDFLTPGNVLTLWILIRLRFRLDR